MSSSSEFAGFLRRHGEGNNNQNWGELIVLAAVLSTHRESNNILNSSIDSDTKHRRFMVIGMQNSHGSARKWATP
jgi:hypothetical protein